MKRSLLLLLIFMITSAQVKWEKFMCCGGTAVAGCSQATTYLAALSGATTPEINAMTTLICGMVTDGTFAKTDIMYLMLQQSQANANVNVINTAVFTASPSAGITITADAGVTGNGSTSFIDTTYVPITNGTNCTANTCGGFVCVLNNRTSAATYEEFGARSITQGSDVFAPLYTSSVTFRDINDIVFTNSALGIGTSEGFWVLQRNASSGAGSMTLDRDGSNVTSENVVGGERPDNSIYILGSNNVGVVANSSADTIATFGMGSYNATDRANLYTRFNTYVNAILGHSTGCATP